MDIIFNTPQACGNGVSTLTIRPAGRMQARVVYTIRGWRHAKTNTMPRELVPAFVRQHYGIHVRLPYTGSVPPLRIPF